ncbi:DNA cytosine methyltransferase [Candidatus Saccharibacteria bacterium]|nr:DNA cytosine methyltransferase [Candidatus Saccharibacteria bacterium]
MIFLPINKIKDKADFVEKVLVYIRLVEVFAERNKLDINGCSALDAQICKELVDMGVIEREKDLSLLKKNIPEEYDRFIKALSFAIAHKSEIGSLLDKLNNKKRLALQNKEKKKSKPNFVDFFAGAGGLSYGFLQAGFRVCFANDFEEVCVKTYQYNHPELPCNKVVQNDIRKIVDDIDKYIDEPIDVVVGGPPCQGFSSANKQRIIDDPRNELYKYYIKAIRKILPKFVVMENVHGMLSVANQVVEDYEAIREKKNGKIYSYRIAYRLLNSVDFSVAQSRERLIYIAVRNDVAKEKNVTPEAIFADIERANKGRPHFILQDALDFIKPLDAPRIKNQNETDDEKTGKKIDVNQFKGNENDYLKLINGNREIPYIFNHKARYLSDVNYEIYRLLNPGDDATDPKIAHIMPYAHRNHCFKDKYFKLIAEKPARTITAHLRMDCHSHIHPSQIRALTPREAARCQSFPDDYLFLGAYLKTYMQIGNAVPCLMAKGIALALKQYL